jgi:prepilin-type processing-associated H-X9-DG protein
MQDMRELRHNARCHADARKVRRLQLFALPGFSLIELLVVCALLIVLTTMYWGFSSPNNQRRKITACQQNLQKIYVAMQIYANDSRGKFPVTAGARTSEEALDVLVPRYTADTSIFICPGSKDAPVPAGESIRKQRISYSYYMGQQVKEAREVLMSDRQIDTQSKSLDQYVFSETGKPPGNNHYKYGGNFLFCDGSAESSPPRVPFSLTVTQGVVLLNPKP